MLSQLQAKIVDHTDFHPVFKQICPDSLRLTASGFWSMRLCIIARPNPHEPRAICAALGEAGFAPCITIIGVLEQKTLCEVRGRFKSSIATVRQSAFVVLAGAIISAALEASLLHDQLSTVNP